MNRLISLLMFVFWLSGAYAHQAAHSDPSADSLYRANIALSPEATGKVPVTIHFLNEHGEQTPAMFTLSHPGSWQQVSLQQQFLPNALHPLRSSERRQWRGKFPIHSAGESTLLLAPGSYSITAGKGLEYERKKVHFEISARDKLNVNVQLQRWVDLPGQGWWSGDTHVHVTRQDSGVDRDILSAAMAEDIHITSTLEMGDAAEMHFPVHTRGAAGRVQEGNYWLVPGQEEPRTAELGHSIVLNTSRLYRDSENYYRYDKILAQAQRDGAVTGLAHYFYAKFHSYRAGALLLPDGLVDFVELLDDSDILSPEQYYDALNMGFELPVSAGSDYPWGAHIGDQRTYVQLAKGEALSPGAWYRGLKDGRSFITQGPILKFTINDRGIGSVLKVKPGEKLHIRAEAQAPPYIGAPKILALVSMGEQLVSASRADRTVSALSLSHQLTVRRSQWFVIVAQGHNGALAHSSPIYVRVNDQPARLTGPAMQALLGKYIAVLRGAGENAIPPEHRTEAYDAWLKRIEAYYINLSNKKQEI